MMRRLILFSILPLFFSILMALGSLVSPPSAKAQCPSTEKLLTGIKKTFPKLQFEIVKVNPTEAPGLCQVQVKVGAQNHLLYTDSRGEFLLAGNLFEAKTGRNLTQETLQLLTRLTPEEMRQIESLTAFTLGQGKKVVYLVTDPQCPYCKQAESLLKKLLEKEEFQVRILLFPLDIHKGAREQSISILCDRKGFEGLETGYRSDHQCAEGVNKVSSTIAFLQKKGIVSTPTFIFSDGIYLSGLISEEELRRRLGLPKTPK
jgi:thiol:disulfide interchange protein DsbC